MNWENRFSTMVKESSVKIDEAKRRLQNIDTSRMHSLNNTSSYPVLNSAPTFQSTPQTGHALVHTPSNITGRDFPADVALFSSSGSTSLTLLHTLCEKVERQSQICDLLNTKVETLQTELRSQQKKMENFKERLSQICFKVDSYEPVQDGQTLEEWKTEIKSELNKINEHLHRGTRDDDKSTASERLKNGSSIVENNELVASCLTEIKHRLDRIEVGLSNNHPNSEHSSKIVEKNMTLLTDWKNTNEKSLTRLCKMQDLSVDEVKHLRSKLYSIEDKVRELESAVNDVTLHNDLSSGRPRSKISVDDDNIVISENKEPTKLYNNSISSEEDKTSLTGSSVHLDVSDDNGNLSLEFDDLNSEERALDQQISHNWASELTDSSLDSLSGSDNYSSSDI